jgi:tRNA A-37 threonylcarbamoyl transferase component Bud32
MAMSHSHELIDQVASTDYVRLKGFAERFEEAWQQSQRPALEEFVPADGPDRWPVLIELIHIDLERRLKAGEATRVEDYLQRYPELAADAGVVTGLLKAEYLLRRRSEPDLTVDDYRRRFPEYADVLRQMWTSADAATVLLHLPGPALHAYPARRTTATLSPLTPEALQDHHTVAGYEILGELGRGGMGVVYKARQVQLNRLVALKMILAGSHAAERDRARFRTEAEAVARLQHPHIVQIYEVGEHAGLPFFSLEFCPGGSLTDRLDGTPLPAQQAAQLVETLARAIHVAHQQGIIHRDLKPQNILLALNPDPQSEIPPVELGDRISDFVPKITDFGLAKQLNVAKGQTQSGAIMGTPCYMAPEQAAGPGGRTSPVTDVYALGAILYELLTGRPSRPRL